MKVKDLLSKREAWTQAVYARDATGVPVLYDSPKASSFCLLGAVTRCYPEEEAKYAAIDALCGAIKARVGYSSISMFNDTHAYEDVFAVVEAAGV